jgi:hypothetical protein
MAMAGSPVAALRAVSRSLDRRVAATPAGRDRTVDLMRAVSIAVVVLWHWTGSVTHRRDGEIVMPNPIDQVPLLWLATWVGQVMPAPRRRRPSRSGALALPAPRRAPRCGPRARRRVLRAARGDLRDDATVVVLDWYGGGPSRRR